MALPTLTPDCLKSMLNGVEVLNPVVQLIQLKRVNPEEADIPRFKLAVTDGLSCQIALASSGAGEFIAPFGAADLYSIILLRNYQYSTVAGKRVLIIMEFDLLMPGSKIGRSLYKGAGGASSVPTSDNIQKGQVSASRPGLSNITNNSQANMNAFKNIHPIDSLTPYQNKWCLKVRVTDKKPIKHYSNARGEGKLFSVDFTDNTGQIRATAFNQECDRFYELLKEGQVYYVRGGQVKAANRQFSSLNNDYELTFSSDTQIDMCHDESISSIPSQHFNFVPLNQLQDKPKDALIDIIGILDTVSPCETIVSRQSQKEFRKRNIRLVDKTECSVALTLWGEEAENFESKIPADSIHPVIVAKGVRINDFQGLSLSMTTAGKLLLNPETDEAYIQRGWYDGQGSKATFQNLSTMGGSGGSTAGGQFTLLIVADADRLGTEDKPDYFTIKGTISALKRDNCLYKACPTMDCNKKLVEMNVDSYRCEKCNKEYNNYKWRLMLTAQVTDFSGQVWVTFFEDMAQVIVGRTSEEMGEIKKRDDETFNNELNKALFKTFAFRLRAKMETFNDETRVKYSCVKIEPIKYVEYIRHLQDEVKKLEALPSVC